MSDSEKLVNCGECVHLSSQSVGLPLCISKAAMRDALYHGTARGPHDCPHFAPSPLARIADALEILAKDSETVRLQKEVVLDHMLEAHKCG